MSKQAAAAYSVARLLRESEAQQKVGSLDNQHSSLAQLTQQIDAFLADAPNAPPPLCVEEMPTASRARAHRGEEDTHYVEMNVVAGVLEPKPKVSCPSMGGSTVLLPNEANKQQLEQQKVREAQALLDLMSALGCSEVGQRQKVTVVNTEPAPGDDHDSDSSVAVMDADDLLDEDSSDDDPVPLRRKIEEI